MPRVRDRTDRIAAAKADPGMFDAMRKSIAKKARNQKAPYHCIACVEAATTQPFDEGIQTERRLFTELENADEAKALRYAFFAEREVTRIPDLPKDLKLPGIKSAAVIGAGTMGGGIAMCFADVGVPVKILEATQAALDKGMQRIRDNYAISVRRGSLAQAEMDRACRSSNRSSTVMPRLPTATPSSRPCSRTWTSRRKFRQARRRHEAGRVAADQLFGDRRRRDGGVTRRPQDVAGAHFFAPANVMKLLEVVKGVRSSTQRSPPP